MPEVHGVFVDIKRERQRQNKKWGEQNHHPLEWLAILSEELGEVNKAALEVHFAGHFVGYELTGDYSQYRKELIEVAAVAVAAIESFDRLNEKVNHVGR